MKTRLISAVCISLVLVFAATANAQIKAGSAEDKAMLKILAEKNVDNQIPLLVDFEKQFPQSKALSDVYMMLVDIYNAKKEAANEKKDTAKVTEYGEKVTEYGEKVIKVDPQNVSAYVTVSRIYAMERKNLDVAVSYAQKAVDNVEKMKTQPAQSNYTDAEWKQLIKDNEEAAKGQLNYAKAVKQ